MKFNMRFVTLTLLLCMSMSVISFANAAEPPGTVLVVEGNPNLVEAWITVEDEVFQGQEYTYPLEKQYWFYRYAGYDSRGSIIINIANNGVLTSFEVSPPRTYRNTYTYNTHTGALTEGKSFMRSITLVGARVLLTLIIEGIIFFAFGFRNRTSWLVFFILNTATQFGLNYYLNTMEIAMAYAIFALIFAEFWVFLIEMISFPLLIKEHSKKRILAYAALSNFISLIAGGYILTILPI